MVPFKSLLEGYRKNLFGYLKKKSDYIGRPDVNIMLNENGHFALYAQLIREVVQCGPHYTNIFTNGSAFDAKNSGIFWDAVSAARSSVRIVVSFDKMHLGGVANCEGRLRAGFEQYAALGLPKRFEFLVHSVSPSDARSWGEYPGLPPDVKHLKFSVASKLYPQLLDFDEESRIARIVSQLASGLGARYSLEFDRAKSLPAIGSYKLLPKNLLYIAEDGLIYLSSASYANGVPSHVQSGPRHDGKDASAFSILHNTLESIIERLSL